MRIFETPEMNIAIFDVNVVTGPSSDPTQETKIADTAAQKVLVDAGVKTTNILRFK